MHYLNQGLNLQPPSNFFFFFYTTCFQIDMAKNGTEDQNAIDESLYSRQL